LSKKLDHLTYGFLNEIFKKHTVRVSKIHCGQEQAHNGTVKADFTMNYSGNFHTVGALVSDVERGPFISEVTSLQAVSASPASNLLNIEMTASLYRYGK
jgi:Tfp pilus assembly protein PilO